MTARCCVVCAPHLTAPPNCLSRLRWHRSGPGPCSKPAPVLLPHPPTDTTVMLRPSHTLLKRLGLTRTTCGFRRSADALSHSQIIIFLPTFLTVGVAPSKATRTPPPATLARPAPGRGAGTRDTVALPVPLPPARRWQTGGEKGNFYGEGNHWNGVIITGGSGDTQGDTRVCWV